MPIFFLLEEPTELRAFCSLDSRDRFLVTLEEVVALWPYGNFGPMLPNGFAPINAGLVGQQAGADLSQDLEQLHQAWDTMLHDREVRYHDEQGAIALLLQKFVQSDEVVLLNPS